MRAASFLVCGAGGVGSWAAEALVRSAAGRVVIIDFDCVQPSNLNRQLEALTGTIGQPKAGCLAERLRAINPDCAVEARELHLTPEIITALLDTEHYDGIIDAIDERAPKLALLEAGVKRGLNIVSSMGAGNKTDPAKIACGGLNKTAGCPFAKIIRKELRKRGITAGVTCVYSTELPVICKDTRENPHAAERRPLGSMVTVTAIFGLRCAQAAMEPILKLDELTHLGDCI